MEEIDLKDLLEYFLGKISWIIIAVALAVVIGNAYTIFVRIPMYRSSATLVLVSENTGDSTSGYNTSEQQLNKNLVGTYSEIIKSKAVLNEVISNLNLDYTPAQLQKKISVASVNNTEVITISVVDSDNKLASEIANETARVFVIEANRIYKLNNITTLDQAEPDVNPYNVNYIKDNLIFVAIGLVVSCGIVFLFFYFDTTIKTSEEIENKLGLTIVGIVPKVRKEQ